MNKKNVFINILFILLLTCGMFFISTYFASPVESYIVNDSQETLIDQQITGSNGQESRINVIYYKNSKIGYLHDETKLNKYLDEVYNEKYKDLFPNSSVKLGESFLMYEEMTNTVYEDKDDEILAYLYENADYAFEVNKVVFSNGNVAYVKDMNMFNQAKEKYLLNFIDSTSYGYLKQGLSTPTLKADEYGSRYLSLGVQETVSVSKGYGPISKILITETDLIMYFSYGYNEAAEYHTVAVGDSVESIAYAAGMYPQNLITINPEIVSQDQVLEIGKQVNVTYYNSPITVQTKKEYKSLQTIDRGDTQYIRDDSLLEGKQVWVTYGSDGVREVTVEETYENGEIVSGVETKSTILKDPVRPQLRIGTRVVPSVGSGTFRWPIANPVISCRVGCYSGHKGLDMYDRYVRAAPILAADRGKVTFAGWDPWGGWEVRINHNNGFTTIYKHMVSRPIVNVGQVVAKGERIGTMGNTGVSNGVHLHLEIWLNGAWKNPCSYLGC